MEVLMADNNSRPVVRRLHKGRVCGCVTILIIIIILISTLISSCNKKNGEEKKPDATDVVANQTVTTSAEQVKKNYIICVDPGHGGDDVGSGNSVRYEKVDNLRYATVVYDELKKRENIDAIMTRTDDTYLDNEQRAKFANDAKADLYLALHRNESDDKSANGIEVWIQQEKSVVDEVLGFKLTEALKAVGVQSNRGVQAGYTNDSQNNFQIIEWTDMPACIVELGFISNDEDNRLFDENYKEYAIAIADVVEEMCTDGYLDNLPPKH